MATVVLEPGAWANSRAVGIENAGRRRRSDVPSSLDHQRDLKAVLGHRQEVERFRRQAHHDGMLGRDGERFDKLI